MSRPLRIEYPDAWYHVMNRGRRGEAIYSDDTDYALFTDLLEETALMWNIRIAAYCLMSNHYHMLVRTPDANLSRGMRHLNGVYTQRCNSRHRWDGPLFRGRYKSILIDSDSYLLQAVRYIHRNPLRAGLVKNIGEYPWSSHQGYVSIAKKWDWLEKADIFSLLSQNRKDWLRYYKKWVSVDKEDDVTETLNRKRWPVCLGPQSFIDMIKERYGEEKIRREVPLSRDLLPDAHRIMEAVCKSYETTTQDLLKMQRGKRNDARNVSIYLIRKLRKDTLNEIGKVFGIDNDSTVSSVLERIKKRMAKDRHLSEQVNKIVELLKTGQERT